MPSAPYYILCGIAQSHSRKSYDHSKLQEALKLYANSKEKEEKEAKAL
jgi:hypothetical protein